MTQLDTFLNAYGLAAIFVLVLVKSIGVPIPIPYDAILLATAARCAQGKFDLGTAFISILAASLIGGIVQFLLLRTYGRRIIYRFGPYLGLTQPRLDAASARLGKCNPPAIAIALVTPGIHSITVAACGLASMPLRTFGLGLTIGTTAYLGLFFALGYAGGTLLQTLSIPLTLSIAGLLLLVIFGYAISRRQVRSQSL